ncbi:SseB family protein [Clostridium sp. 'White wine YQ']|uniref:SseB family protein n=1 Tax=Clostridium sp. 'White wine YQ' TaxID=3027474 RepID=UPI0023662BBE|nr:SseB family protein [Clostridium sp. 'White wine YQ']MDD7794409.1 SseB family protein [Clostridium sp. 'White wine YQ']
MTEERKDELGGSFLLKKEISLDGLNELEVQEIIFLVHSAKHLKANKVYEDINFDEKIKVFLDVLEGKIKSAEEFYVAYDKNTNYPYIDNEERVWMFSKENYAKNAQDYFMQQLLMLDIRKLTGEDVLLAFARLHTIGIDRILIDNGEYNIEINRDGIVPPPDWTDVPEINIPVTNPMLQRSMIKFFQLLYSKQNFEGRNQVISALESEMINQVLNAKYLLPIKVIENTPSIADASGIKVLKEGTTIQIANIVDEKNIAWLPAFTDWIEFNKVYDENEWQSNITTYDDLLALSEKMQGIVINCKGVSLSINDINKKKIEEFRK